jgi:very-short-patch-repair endonuclease
MRGGFNGAPLRGGWNGCCFTWAELRRAGLTASQIKTRVARGELVRRFPRVYVAGDPELIPWCSEAAALRSLGLETTLGFRTAIALWELGAQRPRDIDVIVPRRARPRKGVVIHRVRRLDGADIRTRRGLNVTSPARSLVDFAAVASLSEVEEAIAMGLERNRIGEEELRRALERMPPNHPGAAAVKGLLARDGGAVMTRSGGERRLRALLREAGLPQPRSNEFLHGFEVDLYWPEYRLVVELDSYSFHSKRRTFERDRRKDQVLETRGIRVIRITGAQLKYEPYAVIALLAQLLVPEAV